MSQFHIIISILHDLTAALNAKDRYQRLLEAMHRVIPYDAAALLRFEDEKLVPIVAKGHKQEVLGKHFLVAEHPRLKIICNSLEPVRFPADSELPDPFDGLLENDIGTFQPVHACLGCSLRIEDELIGVLTADALNPSSFDNIDQQFLVAIGALAAVEMRTTALFEAMELSAKRKGMIASDLMRDMQLRQGSQLIGTSSVMEQLRHEIDLVAQSDFSVLITGETGVGKELAARSVHTLSDRRNAPLIYVNCAALTETLAESELFGHIQGAFTGASRERPGKFEIADGGTIFLDEIGELPLSIQPKLLRFLQEGEIQRVGTDRTTKVDVRIIAATNRNLDAEMKAGRFRDDLFHRLNVFPINVPPLREHKEDIPLLAGYFCDLIRRRLGLGPVRLEPATLDALQKYSWPGNVRELENVLSRITLKTASTIPRGEPVILTPKHLGPEFFHTTEPRHKTIQKKILVTSDKQSFREAVDEFKREMIKHALQESQGNWAAAARALGMHRSNLHHIAFRLGLRT